MAKMRDVAKLAGVSTATVSHVLNQTRKVQPDTSARVHVAIEQLGYEVAAQEAVGTGDEDGGRHQR